MSAVSCNIFNRCLRFTALRDVNSERYPRPLAGGVDGDLRTVASVKLKSGGYYQGYPLSLVILPDWRCAIHPFRAVW